LGLEAGVLQEKHALARVWLERGTEQEKEKTVLKRAMKMLIGKGSFYFQACLCLKHSWHACSLTHVAVMAASQEIH